ncbi:MAG: dihydroorotase [bacterium]
MSLLLKKGGILNPSTGNIEVLDVLISDSKIQKIASDIVDERALVIEAKDKLVVPGLVDVHVHFRQPGQEYKEDIHTGSQAAAAGGFTTVIAEPNTYPPIDTPSRLRRLLKMAREQSQINFYSKAAISKKMEGRKLVDVKALKEAGAVAISDDGYPVPGKRLMRHALIRGAEYGILVNPHCEESEFYRQRRLNKLGEQHPLFQQEPYTSEDEFVSRDVELAEETGAPIHISHVSLARTVEIIAEAKKRGVQITAEATPHHFLLTKEMGKEMGTNAKVNPPLRSKEDVDGVKAGLADGTIDIIASDHAPHSPVEKNLPWEKAPFGVIGLETTLGLVLTYLVRPGILTLKQAVEKMTSRPAKIFGLDKEGIGSLTPGEKANVTIIDLGKKWKVDVDRFYSKGRNCPFNGWELQGKAVMTIVGDKIVMKEEF